MSKGHSKLSPSSASRWMACPGSIALIEKCPEPPEKSYTIEGTAAHALAEWCLVNNRDAVEYPHASITIETQKGKKDIPVTLDMKEAVQVYLDYVKSLGKENRLIGVEQKLDISWVHTDLKGTSDYYSYSDKVLHVVDYKHGQGVAVDPEWNPQGMIYALGAAYELWKKLQDSGKYKSIHNIVTDVEIVIVQPRADHKDGPIRKWGITLKELYHWALNVLKPAALETEKKTAKLSAGDNCRFCPALAVCSEYVKYSCDLAKVDFIKPILPSPEKITPQDIAKILDFSDIVSAWVASVKSFAQSQTELGREIPGYKLVAKRATRKWIDESAAIARLLPRLGEDVFEKKFLSPAKMEKCLKFKMQDPEEMLNGLIAKESSGNTLVKDSDKRARVAAPAAIDFIDSMDFLG